jgi:hypothetical protein
MLLSLTRESAEAALRLERLRPPLLKRRTVKGRIIMVDAQRRLRDGRDSQVAQTADELLALLKQPTLISELWFGPTLNHSTTHLPDPDSTPKLLSLLGALAKAGQGSRVKLIFVHGFDWEEGEAIVARLQTLGYTACQRATATPA